MTLEVQVYPKIGIFTAPRSTHETSIFKLSIKSYLGSSLRGPADTSGSWSKHLVLLTLYSKEYLKFEFF